MNKKVSFDDVKRIIEAEGFKVLSDSYKNPQSRIKIVCPKNHESEILWGNWYYRGSRCKKCAIAVMVESHRKTLEDKIKSQFLEEGFILLTERYEHSTQKLKFLCQKGHTSYVTWNAWQLGQRCKQCTLETKKVSIDTIRQAFENEGYTLLTSNYKNNKQKLEYICPKGHRHSIKWNAWESQNQRCGVCHNTITVTPEIKKEYQKRYRSDNKQSLKKKQIIYAFSPAKYDTFGPQLVWHDQVRRCIADSSILEAKCTYCGKWFTPNTNEIQWRVYAINNKGADILKLYCSKECKHLCPVFRKKSKYRTQEGDYNREVQPELRQMVFERDNWTCKKCGATKSLECHHKEGIRWEPLESADVDKCITYCKFCHRQVHQIEGCKYSDMWCTAYDQLNI